MANKKKKKREKRKAKKASDKYAKFRAGKDDRVKKANEQAFKAEVSEEMAPIADARFYERSRRKK